MPENHDHTNNPIQFNKNKENWLDLLGNKRVYLRMVFGTKKPITEMNFYNIMRLKATVDKMIIPMNMEIEPVPVKHFGDDPNDKKFHKTKRVDPKGDSSKDQYCFYGDYEIKKYLEEAGSTNSNSPKDAKGDSATQDILQSGEEEEKQKSHPSAKDNKKVFCFCISRSKSK